MTANVMPAAASVTYQWKAADTEGGAYTDITGATGKTHKLAADKEGKFIKVEVTGADGYSGTKTSDATAAVTAAG
ncbi:hypothetical protein [Eubacterium callanderi]|uniref:Uncharacterized protein n=1 Tax=Eubacterium callanderi TaxID=53442 RepID=A0A853JSE6_9FIRM|nr:hypothetical protein [Eubacterium callanderi]NZA39542.1 hypothetical protein [Eubacterium callanderi]